jgi:hypothetical protein
MLLEKIGAYACRVCERDPPARSARAKQACSCENEIHYRSRRLENYFSEFSAKKLW